MNKTQKYFVVFISALQRGYDWYKRKKLRLLYIHGSFKFLRYNTVLSQMTDKHCDKVLCRLMLHLIYNTLKKA